MLTATSGPPTDSDDVLIVFNATEKGSVLRMRYEAIPTDSVRFLGRHVSPISFVIICVVLVSAPLSLENFSL